MLKGLASVIVVVAVAVVEATGVARVVVVVHTNKAHPLDLFQTLPSSSLCKTLISCILHISICYLVKYTHL